MVGFSSSRQPALVDMALNHGTRCAPGVMEVLRRYCEPTSLRFYGPADDGALRGAIAADAGVSSEHVLVANGSGALLKSVIPYVIERSIRASLVRMARHLLFKRGYPLIVTSPTYSKVPASAARVGLAFECITLRREHDFRLDLAELRQRLSRRPGLVYLCSPNNPTGNLLLDRASLEALLGEFPESFFFCDEAYADYVTRSRRPQLADLVLRHSNLLLLRSFSFAHGLAAAHVGYAITTPALVEVMRARGTPHSVSRLAAELVAASLDDPSHLERVRAEVAGERARLLGELRRLPLIEVFESETNFIYGRFRNGERAADLASGLLDRGVLIKTFEPVGPTRFDEYFRFTIGLPDENSLLLQRLREHFEGRPARPPSRAPSRAAELALAGTL